MFRDRFSLERGVEKGGSAIIFLDRHKEVELNAPCVSFLSEGACQLKNGRCGIRDKNKLCEGVEALIIALAT